jgi:hypothetical protein
MLSAIFSHETNPIPTAQIPQTDLGMTKWQHRHAYLRLPQLTVHNMFQARFHLSKFAHLNRASKQHARQERRLRFDESISTEWSIPSICHIFGYAVSYMFTCDDKINSGTSIGMGIGWP